MDLIKGLEIGYFRSIYKIRLDGLEGVNIFFGRNDSGKSNLLRALNLFFNNETNPGQEFNFARDLCHARLAEAEQATDVRKFVYVKIWFATPPSWQASLGEGFWVKKQWSVTREADPLFDSSIREHRLQQYLTRFLNRVRFHYVPAIKDRRIFEHLQGEIYKVISRHQAFAASLSDFANALRERTDDLTTGLRTSLNVNSVISPPEDLTDLFRSLDFETNSELGDSYSLTLQRGDGIQVRHIPEILAFLSDRSHEDFHIWGFEEPENSLELANAIDEAKRFCEYGRANNKQVFLTSHSPAFFALDNGDVVRIFVSRSEKHDGRLTSKVNAISRDSHDAPGELMGETPHLPVISTYLKDAHAHIEALTQEGQQMAEQLGRLNRSIVFVEGDSDEIILRAAWETLVGVARPFEFEVATGTMKMESLAKDGRVINRLAPERTVLAVVDNDAAGRAVYRNGRLDGGGRWKQHNSNKVFWCRLPVLGAFRDFMNRVQVPEASWPGCLENLFTPELRTLAVRAGALQLTTAPYPELLTAEIYPRICEFLANGNIPERFFLLSTSEDSKIPFADWVATRARRFPDILAPLRPVVEGIHRILRPEEVDLD